MEGCAEADEKAYFGDFSGAAEIYERLLVDGDSGAFVPLVSLYSETDYSEAPDEYIDDLSAKERDLEYIEKVLACGAIAYKELKSELDFIYDICEGRFIYEN